jgi:hypothetical protein
MTTINVQTILNKAIDFAARIHATAAPEDRKAIAAYGDCVSLDAKPGAMTLIHFVNAMHNVWTPEYDAFTTYLLPNEILILNDSIAQIVAHLENPFGGTR